METQLPSPKRGHSPPIFGPFLLWPGVWMHQDAAWLGMEVGLSPGDCVRWGPRPLPKKDSAPNFRRTSIVTKRLYGSRCHLPNFVALRQKLCEMSVVEKFCSPEEYAKVHPWCPDLSPIDRSYTIFCRHCVVTLAVDCYVSDISLVLYRK